MMLSAVIVVRWDLFDPSACTLPRANYFRALILQCGDFVPWDAERWELDVISRLRIPAGRFGLPIGGAASRGDRLVGDLAGYRDSFNGRARRPTHFRGVLDCDSRRERFPQDEVLDPVTDLPLNTEALGPEKGPQQRIGEPSMQEALPVENFKEKPSPAAYVSMR